MTVESFWSGFSTSDDGSGGDVGSGGSGLAGEVLATLGLGGDQGGSSLNGLDIKHMDAHQLINLSLVGAAAEGGDLKEIGVDEYGIVGFHSVGEGDGLSGCEVYYSIQSSTYVESCSGVMVTGRKPRPVRKAANFVPVWQDGMKEIYNASWLSPNGMSEEFSNYATIVFDDPHLSSSYADGVDNLYNITSPWESIIGYARYINWNGSDSSPSTTVERANTSVVPIKVNGEGGTYSAELGTLVSKKSGSLSSSGEGGSGGFGVEIQIPSEFRYTTSRGSSLDRLIGVRSVAVVGRKVNTLIGIPINDAAALEATPGNSKLMANISSDSDSVYTLKVGDHYIINHEGGNPRIVFACNSRANDPSIFGSGVTVEIGDDSLYSPGEVMSGMSVLPTGGTDGYFVKQIIALLNIQTPCINIYDPNPGKAMEIANSLEYSLAALVLEEKPAPIAFNGSLIDQSAGVIDHDPTTTQSLTNTPYEAALGSMNGGGVSLTMAHLDESACCSLSSSLFNYYNSGNGSVTTYVCGPDSTPSLGGYAGDSVSVVNDIVYSYSDSNSYTVSVTTGPKLLGDLTNVTGGATSMKTENVPSTGTVIQDCGNHVNYKVRLDGCGAAPVTAINASPNVIRVGDIVQCTLYNNAVEQ